MCDVAKETLKRKLIALIFFIREQNPHKISDVNLQMFKKITQTYKKIDTNKQKIGAKVK